MKTYLTNSLKFIYRNIKIRNNKNFSAKKKESFQKKKTISIFFPLICLSSPAYSFASSVLPFMCLLSSPSLFSSYLFPLSSLSCVFPLLPLMYHPLSSHSSVSPLFPLMRLFSPLSHPSLLLPLSCVSPLLSLICLPFPPSYVSPFSPPLTCLPSHPLSRVSPLLPLLVFYSIGPSHVLRHSKLYPIKASEKFPLSYYCFGDL